MTPPTTQRTVAVVADDDADVRSMVTEYLTRCGLNVVEAENGLEVLLQIKRQRPRVVVLDLAMPRLGGLDALKRIRLFDPAIQIAVVTGNVDPEMHRQAEELGAVAVLPKPIDLDRLREVLGLGKEAPSAAESARPTGQARVLIVDDDPKARAMLEHFLASCGYQRRSVADGAAALRAISQDPPDIILLDVELPGLSGTDALPAIRALAPGARIIMVSGTSSPETSRRARAWGADYIVRPVDLDHLAKSLETALTTNRTRM